MTADPHAAVERDVLVRYLDAWTATVLRSHRGGTYVECGEFAPDAFRVFGEFTDKLAGHHLEVILVGDVPSAEPPPGLVVRTVAGLDDLDVPGPMLAHLTDGWPRTATKGQEFLRTGEPVRAAGLPCVTAVDLVAGDGVAERLTFATSDGKHLALFKSELWAVDEFAGIRYRDPADPEGTLVDISLTPQLLPLRRALRAEVARRGPCTVADLQRFTLLETMYRTQDTTGALTAAVSAGEVSRDPEKGRLTARTVITPPGA